MLNGCRSYGNDVVIAEGSDLSLPPELNLLESKGHKHSSIMQAMIVPGNAVTRKTVTAQRMPVRSKSTAAKENAIKFVRSANTVVTSKSNPRERKSKKSSYNAGNNCYSFDHFPDVLFARNLIEAFNMPSCIIV
jgi:hypothetical protein